MFNLNYRGTRPHDLYRSRTCKRKWGITEGEIVQGFTGVCVCIVFVEARVRV